MQDLTISIASHHHVETCLLIQDEQFRSSINREAFFDQQEWALYEHVATEVRETMEEYSFDEENVATAASKKHPVLAVTCRAGKEREKIEFVHRFLFLSLSSASTGLLLLEWVLSDLSHYCLCFLYFLHYT